MKCVTSDAEAQTIFRLGVDLGDVKRLRGDCKSRGVKLNAVNLERVFVTTDFKVKKLLFVSDVCSLYA